MAGYSSVKLQNSPSSPVKIRIPSIEALHPSIGHLEDSKAGKTSMLENGIQYRSRLDPRNIGYSPAHPGSSPKHATLVNNPDRSLKATLNNHVILSEPGNETQSEPITSRPNRSESGSSNTTLDYSNLAEDSAIWEHPRLQYFHFHSDDDAVREERSHKYATPRPGGPNGTISHDPPLLADRHSQSPALLRNSAVPVERMPPQIEAAKILGAELHNTSRSLSPSVLQPLPSRTTSPQHHRDASGALHRHSPDVRSSSYVDLLNMPYIQQMAQQNLSLDNARLRTAVGTNASLLDTKRTLDMYRANVKKTNDPSIQYEFAIFMVNAAQEAAATAATSAKEFGYLSDGLASASTQTELLRESRNILQRLADKSYVFAQYYLADGYASGLFNNGKEDYERAFPLFLGAAKHGHAEAGYRTALCYEFGWGSRKDFAKAVQFYRQAASKNHPGAAIRLGKACLSGDMGLLHKQKEGVKWLNRATESADSQHNSGPFELGMLHLTGYSDILFRDEAYAAQLFTKSAELGHAEANLRMGEAYEHGLLTCPRDPALSIHFYTGAAQAGIPRAMMALCAWYMVGAEPLLEKDEGEAYEWAKRAAETGFPKAEYAVGYFTEMGIGCRRDPLEANVWYVRAADQGDERARQRLAIIREAETGDVAHTSAAEDEKTKIKKKRSVVRGTKDDKDCLLM